MGKYFGLLALLDIGIVFILIYIFILMPETPVHGSFCQLETMQENRPSSFAENDRIIWVFFCHVKGEQSEAQPAGLGPQSMRACMHACMLSHFSHGQLFATLWTVAYQASLSMGFSRQEY